MKQQIASYRETIPYDAKDGIDGLFKAATKEILDLIRQRIQQNKATFLLSSQPVFAEAAQAAYLLSFYINHVNQSEHEIIYKTFFCNSHIEALHGAIKITRHKALALNPKSNGKILIYDDRLFYKDLFDPLSRGKEKALIPNVLFYKKPSEIVMDLDKTECDSIGIAVCLYEDVSVNFLNRIQQLCKEKRIIFILDASCATFDLHKTIIKKLLFSPDVVVWGEGLTDFQVPFGAFSVTDNIYKPWCKVSSCFIHSSTYGGNSLVTSIVRDHFLNNGTWIKDKHNILQRIKEIAERPKSRIEAFCKYVNPITPLIYKAAKLDLDIVKAKGSKLFVNDRQRGEIELIDCVGGGGSNLRGHNPSDIVEDVIEEHDRNRDYWQELSYKLCTLTGLDNAFPAVSGACAVDIAFTLAMLANKKDKSKIIIFKGNYAGKTLISLNGTWDETVKKPFAPLYYDVVYIDIFSDQASQLLLHELSSGKVALVWFELLQGGQLNKIPHVILDAIIKNKKTLGYFIGVDEILNGMFRTGSFLSIDRSFIKPDLATLSKGLSDMSFPIAITLVSYEIYEKAKRCNECLVARYESLLVNQLGSHIALHGLDCSISSGVEENVQRMGYLLKSGLQEINKHPSLLKEIRGEGLHLHLCLNMNKFPFYLFGKEISELLISRLCLIKGNVVLFFCRLLPPLNISELDIRKIISGIEKVFKMNRMLIFLIGVDHICRFLFLLLKTQLKALKT